MSEAVRQVTTRIDRQTARALRQIAAAEDTTTTSLIAHGIHDVLVRHGHRPSDELKRIAKVA